jgi:hypothetical protein
MRINLKSLRNISARAAAAAAVPELLSCGADPELWFY